MPIEKKPRTPLPRSYIPPESWPYPVKNGDTWINIAERNGIDAEKLIYFNFKTNDPDEVNWYLRYHTGCLDPSPSGLNWAFSARAKPGIIYIPRNKVDMSPYIVRAKKSISPFALDFEGPAKPLDWIGKAFDIFQIVDIGLAIAGTAAGGTIMLGISIATAPFGGFVLIGGMHEAALNELRKKQMAEGLSLGIVMTADGRSPAWIQAHGFVKTVPVRNIDYPQYGKQFQGIYNTALVSGIAHGRQFNTVATRNLFAFLGDNMTQYAHNEYSGDSKKWSASKWEDYYRLCAAILRDKKLRIN
ncbi:LysM peptidoglycan-binding domain-containing protein [Bosea sp. (in: a-proteobacteria)]|uniref:LysM peptidoglycan-binding domain-containing protein n=1 Tax=Bosea sp. (in: a-proteobacteria) TaxID=1871050 RepID=UPI00273657E4|nr:LysM peptidoglycan-binding domain-containing protein [Bosea sp. (in: a-proteobacteria)]MDP3406694.1 hypothetical protein [Bosea sp. (in: a-proteobacteria)]